jgi:Fic family protein
MLPDPHLLIYFYIRKQAVLSSQIEGTQSSLSDLLLYGIDETPGVPVNDVLYVSSYVAAMDHGLKRLQRLLLVAPSGPGDPGHPAAAGQRGGQGARRVPPFAALDRGTRPGNAIFVPPPHEHVLDLMGQLEFFLHDWRHPLPILI